jgi:hypothetical protein
MPHLQRFEFKLIRLHPIRKDDLTVSTTDGVERVANVS